MGESNLKRTLLPVQMMSVPVMPGTISEDTPEGEYSEDSGAITWSTYPPGPHEIDYWREDIFALPADVPFAFSEVVLTLTILAELRPTNNWAHLWVEDTASAQTTRIKFLDLVPEDIFVGQVWEILIGATVVATYTVIADDGIPEIIIGLVTSWNESPDNDGIAAHAQIGFIKLEGESDGTAFTVILNSPDPFGAPLWRMELFNERVKSVAFKKLIFGGTSDSPGNGKGCEFGPSIQFGVVDAAIWNNLFEGSNTVRLRVAARYRAVGAPLEVCTPSNYTRMQAEYNFGIVAGEFVPGIGPVVMRWRSTVPVIKPNGKRAYVWGDDVIDPYTGKWCIRLNSTDEVSGGLDTNMYTGLEAARSLPGPGQLPIPWQDRVKGPAWVSMSLLERRPMILKGEGSGACRRV